MKKGFIRWGASVLIGFWILIAGSWVWAAVPLSLSEAISKGIKDNKQLQSLKETQQASEYDYRSSYSKFFPKIGLEGKYVKLNDSLKLNLNDLREAIIGAGTLSSGAVVQQMIPSNPQLAGKITAGIQQKLNQALPDFTMEFQKDKFYTVALTLNQPLFTGGKILANRNQKKAKLELDTLQFEDQKSNVIIDIIDKYLTVKLLEKLLIIRTDLVSNLENHKDKTKVYMNQGLLNKALYMKVVVTLEEAKREMLKTQKDFILAKRAFKTLLGGQYDDGIEFELTSQLFLIESSSLKNLSDYSSQALNNNLKLGMLNAAYKQLEQKRRVAYSEFMPQVALIGKYELHKSALTALEPEWSIGVGASWNIFSGASDYYSVRASSSELKSLKLKQEHTRELILMETEKYFQDFIKAREQYDFLKSSYELAEENLRLNTGSFAAGTVTSLDVVDAQLALEKVKIEQFNAMYDMDIAFARLLKVTGDIQSVTKYQTSIGD